MANVKEAKAEDYGISNPRIDDDGTVTWDKVQFGNYIQNTEPIKWRILSVSTDGTDAFLMADKALDCKPYNNLGVEKTDDKGEKYTDYSCTWETCSIRKWLNDKFYYAAFEEQERYAIKTSNLTNNSNAFYGTEGGNDTIDKIYLLSESDVMNRSYGFLNNYTREIKATEYAKKNGAFIYDGSNYYGNCYWWLRSPGRESDGAAFVGYSGEKYTEKNDVMNVRRSVCPTLHVNLKSHYILDAGEVDTDGNITNQNDGYKNPRVTDNKTTWDCVYFGKYEQNCEKESIEWRVLSVDGNDAFLLAEKGLDCKPYNDERKNVTWETCTLRNWLNNDFINNAFTKTEISAIKDSTVINYDNPIYKTNGGNNTNDKVFLLSIEETGDQKYGFEPEFGNSSKTRLIVATDYAVMNGAWRRDNYNNNYKTSSWETRSPGNTNYRIAGVGDLDGNGYYIGTVVDGRIVIRPALHIDLSTGTWKKAGSVTSELLYSFKETPMPSLKEIGMIDISNESSYKAIESDTIHSNPTINYNRTTKELEVELKDYQGIEFELPQEYISDKNVIEVIYNLKGQEMYYGVMDIGYQEDKYWDSRYGGKLRETKTYKSVYFTCKEEKNCNCIKRINFRSDLEKDYLKIKSIKVFTDETNSPTPTPKTKGIKPENSEMFDILASSYIQLPDSYDEGSREITVKYNDNGFQTIDFTGVKGYKGCRWCFGKKNENGTIHNENYDLSNYSYLVVEGINQEGLGKNETYDLVSEFRDGVEKADHGGALEICDKRGFSFPLEMDIADSSLNNTDLSNVAAYEIYIPNKPDSEKVGPFTIKSIRVYRDKETYLKYKNGEGNSESTVTPTPYPYTTPLKYIYQQRASEVQRWYKPGSYKGYHHDGYGYDYFAIWMPGMYDNEYSSDEDSVNRGIYAPALDEYKGKDLSMGGEFWYEGDEQKVILLNINYTSPDDYPMMIRWENAKAPNREADGLKIASSESSRNMIKANQHEKFTISSFTIPVDAKNGDKDVTGKNRAINVYFPNKPAGALLYNKNNTFHFRDFWIKEGNADEPASTCAPVATPTPDEQPTSTPTPTHTPEPEVICNYTFDDGELGDCFGNNCTLEFVNNMSSGYDEGNIVQSSIDKGKCIKVTGRKDYWETSTFAYKLDKLEPNKKYTLSFDVYHDNGLVKFNDIYATDISSIRALIVHNMPEYAQIGQPRAVFNEEWERVSFDFVPGDASAKNNYLYLELAYPEQTHGGTYSVKNIEEFYVDNFMITTEKEVVIPSPSVIPTVEPTATPTASPTVEPTAMPTATPTAIATPTSTPTTVPTNVPVIEPTINPTTEPTIEITPKATLIPTIIQSPTAEPVSDYNKNQNTLTMTMQGMTNTNTDITDTSIQSEASVSVFIKGNIKYKVIKSENGKNEVRVIGVKNKKCKKITLDSFVVYKNKTYKITEIGTKFITGCKKLKRIYIKAKYITKIDKNAFRGMKKGCEIRVPKNKIKKYGKMIKIR